MGALARDIQKIDPPQTITIQKKITGLASRVAHFKSPMPHTSVTMIMVTTVQEIVCTKFSAPAWINRPFPRLTRFSDHLNTTVILDAEMNFALATAESR